MFCDRNFLSLVLLSASIGCAASKPASSSQTPLASSEDQSDGDRGSAGPALGRAPDVNLVDREGKAITLSSLWQEQGVYLVFYRGNW
jgi:cytochrome oxidase Cu insertion factor (SCO1/SenC/PrrC family)